MHLARHRSAPGTLRALPSMAQLQLPSDHIGKGLQLVAQLAGVGDQLQITNGAQQLSLTLADGQSVSGPTTIARYLASLGPNASALLGAQPEAEAQVLQCSKTKWSHNRPLLPFLPACCLRSRCYCCRLKRACACRCRSGYPSATGLSPLQT